MANAKISALTGLAASDVAPATDVLPIVDTSVTTTKKITVAALGQSMIVLGTEQAGSGTSIDFTGATGVPAGTKRIAINFFGLSGDGTSNILVQLGDSGGFETTAYVSETSRLTAIASSTAGFILTDSIAASSALYGTLFLNLEDASDFSWIGTGNFRTATGNGINVVAGGKALSAELTQLRITTVNGTDSFDAGVVNISYT